MSKTIMIVDDSMSMREMVALTLTDAGFSVVKANDGVDALSKLNGNRVHLIISDVNMPNMDGMTLLGKIKANPSYQFTPVLMLTTESREDLKQKGKELGAKAWMVKPFKPEMLISIVNKLI
ncbi:response regulator [Bowmanella sp. JS7-9]|uniref:Response regulator n=1 Tax=Pseudobowmanella zhangzhouensis TaxID=1537679 RepID=A0ABW1XN25_9ALTE|nr:response regulator [Bowmanella sp. JS7-9]TBX20593.1 chemotaxis protein CheY [Bowmanella sp. JS7-9]